MASEMKWRTAWMRSKDRPLLFVTDVLGAKPEPWQAEALEAVGKHDRVSIRQAMASARPRSRLGSCCGSCSRARTARCLWQRTQDQLCETIWPEIAKCHRRLPEALRTIIDVQAERVVVVQDAAVTDLLGIIDMSFADPKTWHNLLPVEPKSGFEFAASQ